MRWLLPLTFACLAAIAGCGRQELSEEERRVVASLSLAALPALPPDPTNRVADLPQAAVLGEALFFDTGLSIDGSVSCATCHLPDRQFQDDRPLAKGVGTARRRTMPLAGVAYSPWQFWDGRKDTLWSQALGPMEDKAEHGGNRVGLVRAMASTHRGAYEAVFGALPALDVLPDAASPLGTPAEQAAWGTMIEADRMAVDTAFANMGKALAAYVRTITFASTRFDRFAQAVVAGQSPQGDAVFSDLELEGLRLFIGKASCIDCHNGPRFTDDDFHNTGVPPVAGLPEDLGRATGIEEALRDPFNCLGRFSDGTEQDCGELTFAKRDAPEFIRAYKTPSLRGAASRPPYMHAGPIGNLDAVIDHYSAAPAAVSGRSELRGVVFTDRGRRALVAFLRTLDVQ